METRHFHFSPGIYCSALFGFWHHQYFSHGLKKKVHLEGGLN